MAEEWDVGAPPSGLESTLVRLETATSPSTIRDVGATGAGLESTLVRLDVSPSSAGTDDEPRTIGRYVLKGRLGAGAMGVVHCAWDPELDRTIALKVVRTRPGVSSHEVGGLAWLMREAQAMARVSHPNVIQVHDVGVIGDRIFIAMELADGPAFSEWLAQRRPWREIVERFIEIGRGLAAAHAAGLVHRDFKP